MYLNIRLLEKYPWFRHESAMKQEGKGGQIKALISVEGADSKKHQINRAEIKLISDHPTKLHSNLLRIGGKNLKKLCKHQTNKSNSENAPFMSPSAHKIVLTRDESQKMRINKMGHESYLPSNFDDIQKFLPTWVDDKNNIITIGGENGLEVTGTLTYSKSRADPTVNRHEEEIRRNGCHVQDVLKHRNKIEKIK